MPRPVGRERGPGPVIPYDALDAIAAPMDAAIAVEMAGDTAALARIAAASVQAAARLLAAEGAVRLVKPTHVVLRTVGRSTTAAVYRDTAAGLPSSS